MPEEWVCVEGCPVKALGEQSGPARSSGHINISESQKLPDKSVAFGQKRRDKAEPGVNTYSDKGTAARFFQTFPGAQPMKEEHSLLEPVERAEAKVIHGTCLDVMRGMETNSIDAIVTDPPAGINFMNKSFDSDRGGRDHWIAWLEEIMVEALRVLKPGGHALVWALPRTSHWTAMALENAGWQIREVCHHIFGSGFPKSKSLKDVGHPELGTALKPAVENWILCRAPLSEKSVSANFLKHGTGAINIDESRVGWEQADREAYENKQHSFGASAGKVTNGWKNSSPMSSPEEKIEASKQGRWPANLLLSHVPGENGCQRVGVRRVKSHNPDNKTLVEDTTPNAYGKYNKRSEVGHADPDGTEQIEEFRCVDSCPVRELDEQSGVLKSGGGDKGNKGGRKGWFGLSAGNEFTHSYEADKGGASRFFVNFAGENDNLSEYNGLKNPRGESWDEQPGVGSTRAESTSAGKRMESKGDSSPTAGSGSRSTDQSPRDTKSITGTETNLTTNSPISNALPQSGTMTTTNDSEKTTEKSKASSIDDASDAKNTDHLRDSVNEAQAPTTGTAKTASENTSKNGTSKTESEPANSKENTKSGTSSDHQTRPVLTAKSGSEAAQTSNATAPAPALSQQDTPQTEHNRFFQSFHEPDTGAGFKYCAKSSRRERNAGLESSKEVMTPHGSRLRDIEDADWSKRNGNPHPTVKPIALMSYLVKMVTPPGGTVLDPFCGSGSTGCAAVQEGCSFIGIEEDESYVEIAERRIAYWSLPEQERAKQGKVSKARNTYGFKSTDVQRRCLEHNEPIPSGSTTYKCGCEKVWYKVEDEYANWTSLTTEEKNAHHEARSKELIEKHGAMEWDHENQSWEPEDSLF